MQETPQSPPSPPSQPISATTARIGIALATSIGGGSLLVFGAFLFFGPFGLVDLGLSPRRVLVWDATLCVMFCVQHSGMVRRGFRKRLDTVVPRDYHHAFFSIVSGSVLLALVLLWQESPLILARLEGPTRWALRAAFVSAILGFHWAANSIPHFDALGIGPLRARLRGRAPRSWPFAIRGPYRWVRHPMYTLVLVLFWAYPDLTADRLLFNTILTLWIVLGTVLEERDLVEEFGEPYTEYQKHVPMLLPWRTPWPG